MILTSLDMYSPIAGKIVTWSLMLEEETDEGGNQSQVIMARSGEKNADGKDEVARFSPNSTDAELFAQAAQINAESGV